MLKRNNCVKHNHLGASKPTMGGYLCRVNKKRECIPLDFAVGWPNTSWMMEIIHPNSKDTLDFLHAAKQNMEIEHVSPSAPTKLVNCAEKCVCATSASD
jgi:hypothetical protein